MRLSKRVAAIVGISALVLVTIACVTDGEAAEPQSPDGGGAAVQGAGLAAGIPFSQSGAPKMSAALSDEGTIWVTGEGKISVEPDLAVLNLGVEAMADTVSESRTSASAALDAIKEVLATNGIEDRDIQTRRFSIRPEYDWQEITENGLKSSKQVLIGYRVNNSLTVRVRDLDSVGTLIDDVITAGGDATRFNGIEFRVEDTSPLLSQLREEAVNDALAKARHFAELGEVELGRLIFISEPGAVAPGFDAYGFQTAALVESAYGYDRSTPISGGDIEVSLRVQVGYAIQ